MVKKQVSNSDIYDLGYTINFGIFRTNQKKFSYSSRTKIKNYFLKSKDVKITSKAVFEGKTKIFKK